MAESRRAGAATQSGTDGGGTDGAELREERRPAPARSPQNGRGVRLGGPFGAAGGVTSRDPGVAPCS